MSSVVQTTILPVQHATLARNLLLQMTTPCSPQQCMQQLPSNSFLRKCCHENTSTGNKMNLEAASNFTRVQTNYTAWTPIFRNQSDYIESTPRLYRVYTEAIPSPHRGYTESIPRLYRVYTEAIPSLHCKVINTLSHTAANTSVSKRSRLNNNMIEVLLGFAQAKQLICKTRNVQKTACHPCSFFPFQQLHPTTGKDYCGQLTNGCVSCAV